MPTKGRAPTAAAGSSRRRGRRLQVSEWVAVLGLAGLMTLEVTAFGASQLAVAMLFATLHAAALLALLAFCPWARQALAAQHPAWIGWSLFGLLLIALLWGLTPWGPGGPHPAWSYLPGQAGSIAVDRSALIQNVLRLMGLACLFVAGSIIGGSDTRRRALIWALLFALGGYALLAIIDSVTLHAGQRLRGTLLSPNSAATLMGVALLYAVGLFAQGLQKASGHLSLRKLGLESSLAFALAAIFATALALTASRGGLFATLVGLAVLLILQALSHRQRLKIGVALAVLAAVLAVAAIAWQSAAMTADRLDALDKDLLVRRTIVEAHWDAFASAPWFGFGLGGFTTINHLISTPANLPALFDIGATHNLFVQWLEEAGVVGAALMLAVIAVALFRIARGAALPHTLGVLNRATLAAAVVVLLHGLSDFAVQVPAFQALMALVLGTLALSHERGSRPAARSWRPLALGGVTLALCVAGVAPQLAQTFGGDLSAWPTASADVIAARVERDLNKPGLTPDQITHLRRLSDRELSLRPASGSAWTRRAALEFAADKPDAANQALDHAFAVAPLQTSLFLGRARLAYEHWSQLSPTVRAQVVYQVRVEYQRVGEGRLVALANSIRDPAGRVGLAFLLVSLRAKAAS